MVAAGRRLHVVSLAAASVALGFAVALTLSPARSYGQAEVQQPEVENAKHAFEGKINSNAVYVRSGPSDNFYPTVKLDKGTPIRVVGIKYNWLKIEPPKGSFSYVAKAYVQRHGDGTEGMVTENATPNVRAGSDLNAMKTTVQTKLQSGQRVRIVGEQDEYFKIEPPAGAYLYVDQRYVDAVKRVGGDAVAQKPAKPDATDAGDPVVPPVEPGAGTDLPPTPPTDVAATEPSSPDAGNVVADATTKPADAPAPAASAAKFEDLEAKFKDASGKPLVDQPLEDLTTGYTALASQPNLTKQMQRVVDARLAALKVRSEARESYLVLKKNQQEVETRRQALMAEREELQERIKQNDVKLFTAVGTLRTSSLQLGGGGTLYRLTDPETGRTVVYLRSTDASIPALINQFIGVKGDLAGDPALNLKVINNPSGAEVVDQTKVNGSVAAQVVPPSLLPKIPTSATAVGAQGGAVEPQ